MSKRNAFVQVARLNHHDSTVYSWWLDCDSSRLTATFSSRVFADRRSVLDFLRRMLIQPNIIVGRLPFTPQVPLCPTSFAGLIDHVAHAYFCRYRRRLPGNDIRCDHSLAVGEAFA